ncbi:MAG: glycosyltransferase family 8 protein [Lachnospiraceae bacterium]|nr:glycosyltransferase family 8 protein [Lachnospiraceae bacterium]
MVINVAYACNEAYIEQQTVSLTSLFENNKERGEIHVYFIDMGITEKSGDELKKLADKYGQRLHILSFKSIAYDLDVKDTGRHTESVYAKLFFGRIKGIDRILYLDSDTVVTDSLKPLWEMDLGDCVLAGVETIHTAKDNKAMGLLPEEKAINDGVVLMDLVKWREGDYLTKCFDYIKKYRGRPPVLSEGTINNVCRGKIKILDPRYNLMNAIVAAKAKKIRIVTGRKYYSQHIIDEANKAPVIIHYLSGFVNRPWCKNCKHPLKDEYLKYRAMTKWGKAPLTDKKVSLRLRVISIMYNILPAVIFAGVMKCMGR